GRRSISGKATSPPDASTPQAAPAGTAGPPAGPVSGPAATPAEPALPAPGRTPGGRAGISSEAGPTRRIVPHAASYSSASPGSNRPLRYRRSGTRIGMAAIAPYDRCAVWDGGSIQIGRAHV